MTTTIESAEHSQIPEATSSFSEVYGDALRGEACTVQGILPDDQVLPVHEWIAPGQPCRPGSARRTAAARPSMWAAGLAG